MTEVDLDELEKQVYKERLKQTGWNQAKASELLSINPRTFNNRLKKYPELKKQRL